MSNYSEGIEILALGRQFNIGTLYNYANDSIISSMRLWDPEDVSQLAAVDTEMTAEIYLKATEQPEEEQDQFLSNLGMDDHTAMSLVAGLLRPSSNGAWHYAADWVDFKAELFSQGGEIAVHCRHFSKEVSIDPEKQLEIICRLDRLANSQATHVVVAVTYGREAFCIFPKDKSAKNYANFFQDRLMGECKTLEPNEDETSDEDEEGGHCPIPKDLQCILYSDLIGIRGGKTWTLGPVADQYKACRQLLEDRTEKAIPLKVWLYPLHKLMNDGERLTNMSKCDVDVSPELTSRCQAMLSRFHIIRLEVEALTNEIDGLEESCHYIPPTFRRRFKQLTESMTKFLSLLTKALAVLTVGIRNGTAEEQTMADIIEAVESQSPFNAGKLKRWLHFHRLELKTLKSLDKLPGVFVVTSMERLQKEIQNGGNGSHAVVRHLPSLSKESGSLVDAMSRYINDFDEATSSTNWMDLITASSDPVVEPTPSTYRQIFTWGQEFSSWITNSNFDIKNVRYIIFYDECCGINSSFMRLYKCGREQAAPLDFDVPKAPGQVKVKKNLRGVIVLNWTAGETMRSTNYLLQYRKIDGLEEYWDSVQHSSQTIKLSYLQSGETYLFRVAADTLGGRSPFSPVSCEVTIDPVCPPPTGLRAHEVTDTSIATSWHHQRSLGNNDEQELSFISYSVECWMGNSRHESTFIQRSTTNKNIVLEPLTPGTIYHVQVRVECRDAGGSTLYSPASEILKITTLRDPERAAHVIRRTSQKCPVSPGIDVYQLPLKNRYNTQIQGDGHYVFGEPSYLALVGKRRQRTILVIGATGSGKSTLINAMVNYVLGIEWEDDFRFKLISEPDNKSQAISQTDSVTTYDLYEMKGSRLGYSLTIVDTPGFGDTSGIEKDKKIMQQIKDYFQCPHGIRQLEAVCFVVQASLARLTETQQYIFDQILSIFGQNIKDNIRLMVTFADGGLPPVLDAIKAAKIPSPIDPTTKLAVHHKFNNSIFFTTNKGDRQTKEFNRNYFDMAVKGFDKFFDDLSSMEVKSLTPTREVLEERKRLEILVEGLQLRTQIKLARIEEFEQIKKKLNENRQQMDANKNFDFEVEFLVPQETDISGTGQFTTNCQNCNATCHFPCSQANDADKHRCSIMDPTGRCRICQCQWNDHFNQKYRYEMVKKKVQRSSDALRKQYQGAKTEALTNEELLASIQKDIDQHDTQLMELMGATSPCIQRLNEIALKPHTLSTPAYIDLMIATEKQEHRPGYQQRITTLERLRRVAVMTAKLVNDQQDTSQSQSQPQTEPSVNAIPGVMELVIGTAVAALATKIYKMF